VSENIDSGFWKMTPLSLIKILFLCFYLEISKVPS